MGVVCAGGPVKPGLGADSTPPPGDGAPLGGKTPVGGNPGEPNSGEGDMPLAGGGAPVGGSAPAGGGTSSPGKGTLPRKIGRSILGLMAPEMEADTCTT